MMSKSSREVGGVAATDTGRLLGRYLSKSSLLQPHPVLVEEMVLAMVLK